MSGMPNKHWVALLTFIGLLPLVYFIPEVIATHISSQKWAVTLLAVAIIVPIISYLWLPFALKTTDKLRHKWTAD